MSRRSFLALLGTGSAFTAAAGGAGGYIFHGFNIDDIDDENRPETTLEEDEEKRILDLLEIYEIPSLALAQELDDSMRYENAKYSAIGGAVPLSVSQTFKALGFQGYKRFSSTMTASGIAAYALSEQVQKAEEMLNPTKITPTTLTEYYGLTPQNAENFMRSYQHDLSFSAGISATAIALLIGGVD